VTLKKTLESVSLKYRRGGDMRMLEDERDKDLPQALFSFSTKAKIQIQKKTYLSIRIIIYLGYKIYQFLFS
jgi:hypothetical protein